MALLSRGSPGFRGPRTGHAMAYVEALASSRELGVRNDDLKQYVQRLRATSPAAAALVDRAVLERARKRRPGQDS